MFEQVDQIPKGTKVVDSKLVLTIKENPDGSIERYKARVVARGFTQHPDEYGEISSPVIDAAVIRYSLGLAATHDLEIAVLDVPTAYLGATLHEEVYMRLPEADWTSIGFSEVRPVVKLRKSVPGLKQSGRSWYEDITTFLTTSLNLKQSISAPGLFFSETFLLNLYVDDLMLIGKW